MLLFPCTVTVFFHFLFFFFNFHNRFTCVSVCVRTRTYVYLCLDFPLSGLEGCLEPNLIPLISTEPLNKGNNPFPGTVLSGRYKRYLLCDESV